MKSLILGCALILISVISAVTFALFHFSPRSSKPQSDMNNSKRENKVSHSRIKQSTNNIKVSLNKRKQLTGKTTNHLKSRRKKRIHRRSSRKAIKLLENQVLIAKCKDGVAGISFPDFGNNNEPAEYHWRFKPSGSGNLPEDSGNGVVFEHKERIKIKPGHYRIKDLGSKKEIIAGPVRLSWSYASTYAGWIYFNPEKLDVVILSDTTLENAELKK